jgi:hypothetical protein
LNHEDTKSTKGEEGVGRYDYLFLRIPSCLSCLRGSSAIHKHENGRL